jgi:hypothetical protein
MTSNREAVMAGNMIRVTSRDGFELDAWHVGEHCCRSEQRFEALLPTEIS